MTKTKKGNKNENEVLVYDKEKYNGDFKEENTSNTMDVELHFDFEDEPENTENTVKTDESDDEQPTSSFVWGGEIPSEKQQMAYEIMSKIVDFNLSQLKRRDADTVLIYDDPAEYASALVNELFENVE